MIDIICTGCAGNYEIKIKDADLIAWQNGALIQNVAPYLSVSERELLISQTCDTCWIKLFGDADE